MEEVYFNQIVFVIHLSGTHVVICQTSMQKTESVQWNVTDTESYMHTLIQLYMFLYAHAHSIQHDHVILEGVRANLTNCQADARQVTMVIILTSDIICMWLRSSVTVSRHKHT